MAGKPRGQQASKQWFADELDIAILKALPRFGAKIGKYMSDGVAVRSLPPLVDPSLAVPVYAGRMLAMKYAGMIVAVKGPNKGLPLYQRSEKGEELINEKPTLRDVSGT